MENFFNPGTIAVIGASPRKTGLQLVQNLAHGFRGRIYPVNPKYDRIQGLTCYPALEQIPESVDLVIMLVSASLVPSLIEACRKKKISHVMLLSAGFAEVGSKGSQLQATVTDLAEKAGIRIWGPNCMGLIDAHRKYFFTFMSPRSYASGLPAGGISLVVQSGMLLDAFIDDLFRTRSLGVAKVCSIGNKMDVDECDLLEYLLEDDHTQVIALYLESIARGQRFTRIARRATKPIILLKGGRSKAGAVAAMSHTSSLAGNSRLADAILEISRILPAHDFHQMMDLANGLSLLPELRPGSACGVLTFSGGAGILACDLLEENGVPLARLSSETQQKMDDLFPDWMPAGHPVDLYPAMENHGHVQAYDRAISILLNDPGVDILFIHYVALNDDTYPDLDELKTAAARKGKAVVFWILQRRVSTRDICNECHEREIPVFREMSRAVETIAAAVKRAAWENMPVRPGVSGGPFPTDLLADRVRDKQGVLDEYDSKKILAAMGINTVAEHIVTDMDEAVAAGDTLGYPLVLKGLDPGQIHKTESGLVKLGILNEKKLAGTFKDISRRIGPQGRILVQRQISPDYELIAGFIRDLQFGPCIMFGMGGIFSELEPDVGFAPASLDRDMAYTLIRSIRKSKLFQGFRGLHPLNTERMADTLIRLGQLGMADDKIQQIDINPVCILNGNPVAVDATMILT